MYVIQFRSGVSSFVCMSYSTSGHSSFGGMLWSYIIASHSFLQDNFSLLQRAYLVLPLTAQIVNYICPDCKLYFPKLPNVFVSIAKCICTNSQMYFISGHSSCKGKFLRPAYLVLPLHIKGKTLSLPKCERGPWNNFYSSSCFSSLDI